MDSSTSTRSSLVPKILLLAAAVILSAALCEFALRVMTREPAELSLLRGDDFQSVYFDPDPVLGVVRKPNLNIQFRFEERPSGFIHFQTNNLGLRRVAPTRPGRFQGRRMLVLGDSQIDGSVDNRENLCTLLEQMLNAGPVPSEVLNAATGSYSPFQSYLWYRTRGRDLEPDIVLQTVFLGNDLAELAAPGRPRLVHENGAFREIQATDDFQRRMSTRREATPWEKFRFFLLQNSVLFGRLTALAGGAGTGPAGPMGDAYRACIGCTGQGLGQAYWFRHHADDESLSLASLEELLRRFKLETDQAGTRLVLLVLPGRLQVEAELDALRIRQTADLLGLSDEDENLEQRLGRETVRIAGELGVETVDLTPLLSEYHRSTGRALYYQTDWHLNAEGHRFLADQIHGQLYAGHR